MCHWHEYGVHRSKSLPSLNVMVLLSRILVARRHHGLSKPTPSRQAMHRSGQSTQRSDHGPVHIAGENNRPEPGAGHQRIVRLDAEPGRRISRLAIAVTFEAGAVENRLDIGRKRHGWVVPGASGRRQSPTRGAARCALSHPDRSGRGRARA